jgi:hypothetical protein
MNNRIQDIADQCWSHHINGVLIDGHLHFDYEKFGKLILQECVNIVADAVDHREPASTYVSKMKSHFGVKE